MTLVMGGSVRQNKISMYFNEIKDHDKSWSFIIIGSSILFLGFLTVLLLYLQYP